MDPCEFDLVHVLAGQKVAVVPIMIDQVFEKAPPAGFEPAHTAPEAVALSPELWGLARRRPRRQVLRGLSKGTSRKVLQDTCSICERETARSR